jgi:DNA-binding IclR family transcriptional regulator
VSRGLGRIQRGILEALNAGENREMEVRELRQRLGDRDRSNVRRGIRGLVGHGLVEEGEACCIRLTMKGAFVAYGLFSEQSPDPREELRRINAEWDEFARVLREAQEERARLYQEQEAMWEKPEPRYERWRYPSKNQLRVIAVLVRYAANPQKGLPASAVRRIAGIGDKSNARRAERTLLQRGTIQRSKDGERLRIAQAGDSILWSFAPNVVDPPLDDGRAQTLLEGSGEWAEVVA